MADDRISMTFRASPELYEAIQGELARLGTSFQVLAEGAIQDRLTIGSVEHWVEKATRALGDRPPGAPELTPEGLKDIILGIISSYSANVAAPSTLERLAGEYDVLMPKEKILVMEKAMRYDLEMLASSRKVAGEKFRAARRKKREGA